MATMDRAERERITEIAKGHMPALKTVQDLYSWYADYFAQLGAKTLGGLINDERLRIEANARETARRMRQKAEERHAIDRDFGYSEENLARRGQGKGTGIAWNRERKAQIQDRKDIAEEDRRAEDIAFSEGQGERALRTGDDVEVN